MSNSVNSPPEQPLDKGFLYGEFFKPLRWRQRLNEKLAHKALDIPMDDDEMQVTTTTNNNNIKSGWGWREMLAGGCIGTIVWALMMLSRPTVPPPLIPIATTPNATDTDTTRRITIEPYDPQWVE